MTFSTGRQRLSYYTQQSHNAPDTDSDLLYKTVLRDKSKVVWRGDDPGRRNRPSGPMVISGATR